MKLNANGLSDRKQWEEKGYALPQFDREAVTAATKAATAASASFLEILAFSATLSAVATKRFEVIQAITINIAIKLRNAFLFKIINSSL